ncbi:MAG: hypothetical protein RL760_182 [Candidatus Eisenbacteria bacterium]
MRASHVVQSALLHGVGGVLAALPRPLALGTGAAIGDLLAASGLRRRVVQENLLRAFPERDEAWRTRVLHEHYREVGRIAADYTRLPELVHGPRDHIFRRYEIEAPVREALAMGRGLIVLTGHFGHFELFGATVGRLAPLSFVVKPLSNPGAESWIRRIRERSGVGAFPIGSGVRDVIRTLRGNGVIAMIADQDARRDGVFVPFFGHPASTPVGPARFALMTGTPVVFGHALRAPDGRYDIVLGRPIVAEGRHDDPEAIRRFTAWHTAQLEAAVRERPESWFWMHKRWKTAPPVGETS